MTTPETRHLDVRAADGTRISVTVTGTGQPVMLLHGFPDSSALWRHQVPALAAQGYQVIVPDQRGFGASDKPQEVAAYLMQNLVEDVNAIRAGLGVREGMHLVGHDWGANVAWAYAHLHPEATLSLTALASGHPSFVRSIRGLEMSWYVYLFQFEGAAERLLAAHDWKMLRDWGRDHPEAEAWTQNLEAKGALTSALNWYRANYSPERDFALPITVGPVQAPTLGIFGRNDHCLQIERMEQSAKWVEARWRMETLDCGHWIPLDQPQRVNELLLSHLTSASTAQHTA